VRVVSLNGLDHVNDPEEREVILAAKAGRFSADEDILCFLPDHSEAVIRLSFNRSSQIETASFETVEQTFEGADKVFSCRLPVIDSTCDTSRCYPC